MESSGLPRLILDGRFLSENHLAAAMQRVWAVIPVGLQQGTVVLCGTEGWVGDDPALTIIASSALGHWLDQVTPPWVAYWDLGSFQQASHAEGEPCLPCGLGWPAWTGEHGSFIAPWVPTASFPLETAQVSPFAVAGWMATGRLVSTALPSLSADRPWSLLALAEILEQQGLAFQWRVAPVSYPTPPDQAEDGGASVLAIVPHYQCEPWLRRCLLSLLDQTRPPDGIVVVDDGSPVPPLDLVAEFPTVTLMVAADALVPVGPYRLIQAVIEATAHDYYLFQDADDWSSSDRLAQLLATAQLTQADLVGTQEIRVEAEAGTLVPVNYPLDVNRALAEKPGHPLLHPTSLMRCSLITQVGGFATGLRFGGDTEFLLRAAIVGRVVNSPDYGYFRQKRPHSLTTDPATGLNSSPRQALLKTLKQRAIDNQAAIRQGLPPDLQPLCQAPPLTLQHLCGPPLSNP